MNSTNIKVISEEIQRLKDQVHAIDVEVPDPSDATDGQILSIDDGKYVITDPELPAVTDASTGDVLGLVGEAKTPGWITPYNPPAYSTTEILTGQKWIDGKDIYCKVLSLPEDTVSTSPIEKTLALSEDIDTMIYYVGSIYAKRTSQGDYSIMDLTDYYSGDVNTRCNYGTSNSTFNIRLVCPATYHFGCCYIIAYYTKTDPETTVTSTRKKTTKKGE